MDRNENEHIRGAIRLRTLGEKLIEAILRWFWTHRRIA